KLKPQDLEAVTRFREWAQERGGDKSYIAQQRADWWSVQLYEPAPIICTYMGRRPPVFAVNSAKVRHLNIAHGLYPRLPVEPVQVGALVEWLNANASASGGRLYAGALIKFEPNDIGAIRIPVDLAAAVIGSRSADAMPPPSRMPGERQGRERS